MVTNIFNYFLKALLAKIISFYIGVYSDIPLTLGHSCNTCLYQRMQCSWYVEFMFEIGLWTQK